MTSEPAVHRLLRFINEELVKPGSPVVGEDTELFASGLLNSLRLLDLLAFVELLIDREIDDEEVVLDRFATPRRIGQFFDHG